MPRSFYLTAKPGCDLVYAIENPSYDKTDILEVDNDGTVLGHIPYLSDTDHMYKPEPDPAYQRPQKIVTLEGEVEIPRYVPEDKVTDGENPFVQLIYRYVKRQGEATMGDILRYITQEKKYLPQTKYGYKRVKSLVTTMHKGRLLGGLLIWRDGHYMTGLKLETGKRLLDAPSGYDPYEYHIMRYAENKGTFSRDEIHRLLLDRYNKWARKTGTVEFYIMKLLKMKCIRQLHSNWFEYKKFPESNEVLFKKMEKPQDINP